MSFVNTDIQSPQSSTDLRIRSKLLDMLHAQRLKRQRCSRMVHDHIGQYLTSISINAGLLVRNCAASRDTELAGAIAKASRLASSSTRELTGELGPSSLCYQEGLGAGLLGLVQRYDIDSAAPQVECRIDEFFDSASAPTCEKIGSVFEQFLLQFLKHHRPTQFVISLLQTSARNAGLAQDDNVGTDVTQLQVHASGTCVGMPPTSLEQYRKTIEQRIDVEKMQLSFEEAEHSRKLTIQVEFSAV